MAFNFSFKLKIEAEKAVPLIKTQIIGKGGTFTGNTTTGSFSMKTPVGSGKGTYFIKDGTCTIQITDKPFLVTESKVKTEVLSELKKIGVAV